MSDQLKKFGDEIAAFSQQLDKQRRTKNWLRRRWSVDECFERLGSIVEMFVGDLLQAKASEPKITLDIRGDVSRVTLGENDTLVVKVKVAAPMALESSEQLKQAVAEGLGIEPRRVVVVSVSPLGHDMEFGVVREGGS